MFKIPVIEVISTSPWALLLLVLPILPNLWAILHIFRCDFNTAQEKMVWIALAVFVPLLGGIAYLVLGRRRGVKVS